LSAANVAPPATTPSTVRNSTTRITAVMRIPATELWAIRPTSAALRQADQAPVRAMGAVRAAVEEGERAAAARDWIAVGTANMRFHQALTALAAGRVGLLGGPPSSPVATSYGRSRTTSRWTSLVTRVSRCSPRWWAGSR